MEHCENGSKTEDLGPVVDLEVSGDEAANVLRPPKPDPLPVGYAYSAELIDLADRLPANEGRASRVHDLIVAYGLDKHYQVIEPKQLMPQDLSKYHQSKYVEFLQSAETANPDELESDDEYGIYFGYRDGDNDDHEGHVRDSKRAKYGLEYDCPVFQGLWDYVRLVSGATVACADYLTSGQGRVAINWTGGRHHAKRAQSSGFCYINDIVLGIQRLRTTYDKVMYIDLDLHHGDGVEAAFSSSRKVLTVSVHRLDKGFFPGTGQRQDSGKGLGEGYTINIPTERGLSDASLKTIFDVEIVAAKQWFDPDAVVITCGVDGLTRDQHREWNLTFQGFEYCILQALEWDLPTLVVGGGGYHHSDTARCWAYVTAAIVGQSNSWDDIPDHQYIEEYKVDTFQFWVDDHLGKMKDENKATAVGQNSTERASS